MPQGSDFAPFTYAGQTKLKQGTKKKKKKKPEPKGAWFNLQNPVTIGLAALIAVLIYGRR
jgi:hypothetical protein